MANKSIIPYARIEQRILRLRGQNVLLDADLAVLYGVSTKRFNEQVRRNANRFPKDFMFQLSPSEKSEVVANCDHLAQLKFSPYLPYAFTEHGVLMLANVLNSPRAVRVSVAIVRTFVRLRKILASNEELGRKLEELERKYDRQFTAVFDAIRQLITPPERPKRRIGFGVEEPKVQYRVPRRTGKR